MRLSEFTPSPRLCVCAAEGLSRRGAGIADCVDVLVGESDHTRLNVIGICRAATAPGGRHVLPGHRLIATVRIDSAGLGELGGLPNGAGSNSKLMHRSTNGVVRRHCAISLKEPLVGPREHFVRRIFYMPLCTEALRPDRKVGYHPRGNGPVNRRAHRRGIRHLWDFDPSTENVGHQLQQKWIFSEIPLARIILSMGAPPAARCSKMFRAP